MSTLDATDPYWKPYWRKGQPVTNAMSPMLTDLCDACGHARDTHKLTPLHMGFPCKHPKCDCQRSNGFRRCVGPAIAEVVQQNGLSVPIKQPAPPGPPIHYPSA